MRLLTLVALLSILAAPMASQAQELSKEDAKIWKKKAKEYRRNPAALKALADDVDRYREEAATYSAQVNEMEAERANQRQQIAQLERDNVRLQDELSELRRALADMNNQPQQPAMGDDLSGLVFRVQIGAYQALNMPANLDGENDNMDLEVVDGLQKIIIGHFPDVESAEALRSYMQKIGVKDAWVVAYQDGARVPMSQVVPGYGQ